jgi:hypothetical protein
LENILKASSRRNCPKNMGKYPESRFPAGIVRKLWESILKAASRRNCPKILGKYPESRFPPELSENFGKISGKPLPAQNVRLV